jgi:hypothetical protein
MNLNINFYTRDFDLPISTGLFIESRSLTWSAFGGPKQATLKLSGPPPNLIKALNLLRSPVMISDSQGSSVWWGYVSSINLKFNHARFKVSIEEIYNRVRVVYSYLSPDNRAADQSMTASANHTLSQLEYGIREMTLHRSDIDEDFAEQLRDTFLGSHSWPESVLSSHDGDKMDEAILSCRGWFSTLSWLSYESANGFYANHGPGPGSFTFGQVSTVLYPSQSFIAAGSSSIKYVYFMLQKFGNPTQDIAVALFADGGGSIGVPLSSTSPVSATTLSDDSFEWVRFEFATPYALTAGTKYWLTVDQNGVSAANYFAIRLDEDRNYPLNWGLYFNGSVWRHFPAVTTGWGWPDTYFRAVCVEDTGAQISTIAAAGNQFFKRIETFQTGVESSPYRTSGYTCLKEIEDLMHMGTSSNRLVLAKVTPERILQFYEQPDPENPTVFLDQNGIFITSRGKRLNP